MKYIRLIVLFTMLVGLFSCADAGNHNMESNIVTKVSKSDFSKIVLEEKSMIVAVDFWASWCGPCKKLAPMLEELAVKYKGKIKFVKVNVDENKELSQKYQISSIPNVKFFKNGLEIDEFIGLLPKKEIEKKLDKLLKKL